jgi:hypothetical protein
VSPTPGISSTHTPADAGLATTLRLVDADGLSRVELIRIVNQYIGVSDGYLGNFSYRTHADFYAEYCDIDIDPNKLDGTTRERFIAILGAQEPRTQARIVRGVLARFPVGASDAPSSRTPELAGEINQIAKRLEGIEVAGITPTSRRADVAQAIADVDTLLKSAGGAPVSVDRVHTSLHAYLLSLCDDQSIAYPELPTMAKLVKLLRTAHPRLVAADKAAANAQDVLQSLAQAFDALNPIRNSASMAHPNRRLLEHAEAALIVNAGRTIIAYLNARLG